MALTREQLPKDLETLTTFALTQALELEKLRFEIAVLKRQKYGRSSEQADRELLQMQLRLEDLESQLAARPAHTQPPPKEPAVKPVRRPLPEHLPRESIVHESACACPECGGALRPAGEDVAEMIEWISERYKVIRHVRPKFSCVKCEKLVQAPAPARPIARGLAGPGMLAHVLVSKYADHLPLYRQSQIFARDGIDLDRSTLADWVGGASELLSPLLEALGRYVLSAEKLHADDTPVPVLAPGRGTTKQGRLWTYVRDDRPAGSTEPPAVLMRYSPDRKAERPNAHLTTFVGVLQADGYAGFKGLYDRPKDPLIEAACWAHARRKFFDLHAANGSPVAAEALARIGELYAIEDEIRGSPPDQRREVRQARAGPALHALHAWLHEQLSKVAQKSQFALAIRYTLSRWTALTRYRDDGRIEIDNNAAERSLRTVALGRKNWLFAGCDDGGERAAGIYSLIATAQLNSLNIEAYLRYLFERLPEHPINHVDELLPWAIAAELPELKLAA
ncbi:MAG: IS66 family transposase [Pseudomonadota bacterium]